MLKRIESREEIEKRNARKQMAAGIILVAIMVISTAGYAIVDRTKEQAILYKGNKFLRAGSGWQLSNSFITTRFLPSEVDEIQCNCISSAQEFADRQIYLVAFTDSERIAADEVLRNLQFLRVQRACLQEEQNNTGCEELPLKSCDDDTLLIIKTVKNTTMVYEEGKCILIEAPSENLTMAADRLVFSLYKIIS